MLTKKQAALLFAFLMSGLMSCIVSGAATLKALGWEAFGLGAWWAAWSFCWPIAFAILLVATPLVRRWVARLTIPSEG